MVVQDVMDAAISKLRGEKSRQDSDLGYEVLDIGME